MNLKLFCTLLISIVFLGNCYSQNEDLLGKWILVRTLLNSGENIDANSPIYSTKVIYDIEPGRLKINDFLFDATFTKEQIKMQTRTINYSIKDKYLLVQDINDNKTSYFLKVEDFIQKFPEFELEKIERNGAELFIDNHLSGYEFNNDLSFHSYMNKYMKPDHSGENLYFKMEFILTRDNQVKDVKVLQSLSKDYDEDYLKVFNQASKFFTNISGKDLLIYLDSELVKLPAQLTDKNEKKLYELLRLGLEYYSKNKFEKVIEKYSQISNLDIRPNRYTSLIKDATIKLGVSYLAVGKFREACQAFERTGSITDFEVRNYLLDFCSK